MILSKHLVHVQKKKKLKVWTIWWDAERGLSGAINFSSKSDRRKLLADEI